MIFDDLRFWMPHGDDVSDLLILLLKTYTFTADRDFHQSKLFIEPVNNVREGSD